MFVDGCIVELNACPTYPISWFIFFFEKIIIEIYVGKNEMDI
jgi:hypothetical protein